MCGDSLISTINGEQLISYPTQNEQQLELNVTPVQAAIQPLLKLQQQYYSAHSEERKALRKQIVETEANILRVATADRYQFWKSKQHQLEQDIQRMSRASRTQVKEQQVIAEKLAELDKFATEVERGKRSLNFFQYHLHFNDVFQQKGGFDIVIGNPPYVRNRQICEIKPALEQEYECYTGMADLYVYFYERGFRLLKTGGLLAYISSNKYFRSGYGEKLRKFLGSQATIQHLIDFGDAPVFEAIAYPSIILLSKAKLTEHKTRVLNWEIGQPTDEFTSVFQSKSFYISQSELKADGWRLESSEILRLMEKLHNAGTPLGKYINDLIYFGILTGLNEAFVVDRATKDRLIYEHSLSAKVLKPFVRGRDVKRWTIDSAEKFLIKLESSENQQHPWSGKSDEEAEKIFANTYPAIYNHLEKFRETLIKRDAQGKFFWELRSCRYWQEFSQPKIIYPDIYEHQRFTIDTTNFYAGNTCYFIPAKEPWLCGLLNSQVVEWLYSQISNKVRGGYLRAFTEYIKQIPVPNASEADQNSIASLVQKCLNAKGQGVSDWEAEINERVQHLYGLTAQEMKIIKGE